MPNVNIIDFDLVAAIEWQDDPDAYDLALFELGQGLDTFMVVNPWADIQGLHHYIESVPKVDQCVVWNHNSQWIAKYFTKDWKPRYGYLHLAIEPIEFAWKRNPAIGTDLKFKKDPTNKFTPDPWDARFKFVWYVNEEYNTTNDQVWAVSATPIGVAVEGIKDMGQVSPVLPEQLDVVFISYDEPEADKNWQRVLQKAPSAKRVHGVNGILEAHRQAARLTKTDMVYIVDGDSWLTDRWTFNFQPNVFDRDSVYVWRSENPVNDLIYGYGGVKLFPRTMLKGTKEWGMDLTTSVSPKLKIVDQISNITKFNTSEYHTWRGSFRECVKLINNNDQVSFEKFEQWLTPTHKSKYAKWSKLGAQAAIEFINQGNDITLVNDYQWLSTYFKENYESRNKENTKNNKNSQ